MSSITRVRLKPPYLLLIGAETDPTFAKTAQGIVQWCPDKVAGQLRFEGSQVDLGVPDMSLAEAAEAGCGSLVLGVAPVGGAVPESWWEVIEQAARSGLDIVSGLHLRLRDRPGLAATAEAAGAQLVDVRVPPAKLPVGNGKPRTGRRILTVGPDCAIGKKYTALALDLALREAGEKSTYRATGQTGIMIAGEGIPIDSVVADFISGAAELLSPDNDPDHFDVTMPNGAQALMKTAGRCRHRGLLHQPRHQRNALSSPPSTASRACAPCWPCSRAWPPARPTAMRAWPTSRPPRCCTWARAWATAWPTCTTRARARCPIVNIVGDHATYHRAAGCATAVRYRNRGAQRLAGFRAQFEKHRRALPRCRRRHHRRSRPAGPGGHADPAGRRVLGRGRQPAPPPPPPEPTGRSQNSTVAIHCRTDSLAARSPCCWAVGPLREPALLAAARIAAHNGVGCWPKSFRPGSSAAPAAPG
jgi:hypothetical protein